MKRQGRRTALLAAVAMVVAVLAQTAGAQTWDCGETPGTVTATLSGDTLTISGTGKMKDNYSPGADSNRDLPLNVIIEYGVTYIGQGAFYGWAGLMSVTIPNSVTTIKGYAFSGCSNLTTVFIPSSVTSVEEGLFNECTKLTSITSLNTIPPSSSSNFFGDEVRANACLYVPESSIGAYISANGWKEFTCINVIASATVTFDSRGGSDILPQTVLPNSRVSKPSDPIRYGYVADGWYKDSTYSNEWDFEVDKVTTDMTLYVKWQGSDVIAVTSINDIPKTIAVGISVVLNGTVVPTNATNNTIVWNVVDTGTTNAAVYNGNRLVALSDGIVVVKATIVDGVALGINYEQLFTIAVGNTDAVLSNDRTIPHVFLIGNVAVAPLPTLTSEFTAGPSPTNKASGRVNFFYHSSRVVSATLFVYDASGNTVKKIVVRNNAAVDNKGAVGSWDLTDRKKRQVSDGTYLVKGILKTSNGTREAVSAVVGVR